MKTTRRRAHTLRNATVPVTGAEGRPAPLSNGEKAKRELYSLLKGIPTRQHILIPRNWSEAHRRPDSLCVRLGVPFHILGPLLLAAAILVAHKKGGLSVSTDGLVMLKNLYTWKDHQQINFEEKKPSDKVREMDMRVVGDPPLARIKFYYIYRGQVVPHYSYKPLVVNNLVIERIDAVESAEKLCSIIHDELDPSIAALFDNHTGISVSTLPDPEDGEAPALITLTEQQQQQIHSPPPRNNFRPAFYSPRQPSRTVRSPLARTPGASPPIRRARITEIEDEEVEANDTEVEEKRDEDSTAAAQTEQQAIQNEIAKSMALDFNFRDYNGLRPPRNPSSNPIKVVDRKQATPAMRVKTVWLADRLGYRDAPAHKWRAPSPTDKCAVADDKSRVGVRHVWALNPYQLPLTDNRDPNAGTPIQAHNTEYSNELKQQLVIAST